MSGISTFDFSMRKLNHGDSEISLLAESQNVYFFDELSSVKKKKKNQ